MGAAMKLATSRTLKPSKMFNVFSPSNYPPRFDSRSAALAVSSRCPTPSIEGTPSDLASGLGGKMENHGKQVACIQQGAERGADLSAALGHFVGSGHASRPGEDYVHGDVPGPDLFGQVETHARQCCL